MIHFQSKHFIDFFVVYYYHVNQMEVPLYGGCLYKKIGDTFGDSNPKTR